MLQNTRAGALRAAWADDRAVLGAWSAVPAAFSAELMCVPGVDYVCIDQQHGMIDYPQMVDMMRAVEVHGIVPITRVPANEAWMIGKALDAGIQGVIVPMVNTAVEAAKAVAACRYSAGGGRSYGPIRAAMAMDSRDVGVLGDEVLCFVMIETREAVENIDAIASTPGLDGIYIGPADLALGLGLPPDLDKAEPEHVAAVARILEACQRHGVVPGIQCGTGSAAAKQVERGFRLVTFTKDSALLAAGIERELAAARHAATFSGREKGYV